LMSSLRVGLMSNAMLSHLQFLGSLKDSLAVVWVVLLNPLLVESDEVLRVNG